MHTDDCQTVKAVLHGDKDSYEKLIDKYKKMVYGIAWSHLGDRDLSEDAAQETFVKAYAYLGTLREPERFAGWLARIARNVCGSLGRRMKRENAFHRKLAVLESERAEPQEEDRASLSEQLWDSFAKLPAIHREALTLFYVEGKSIAEASAALGIAEQTMRTRLHRARTALRAQLEQMLEESLADLQPGKGFTRSVFALLPLAPKGIAGSGILAVLGKLSASISFALWMAAVSTLPVWALFSLLGRVEESGLGGGPQNETAKEMIRRGYRKGLLGMFVGFAAAYLLMKSVGHMTTMQIIAVVYGFIMLLVIIGAGPQLRGRVRNHGITLEVLTWGVFFSVIAAIAFFEAPAITFFAAIPVMGVIHYFAASERPPMPERIGYNLFLRQAMGLPGLPEADIRPSRQLSKLEIRTFARLLAELRLVRDYRFEGDTICLFLFSMQSNPLVGFGIVPSGSQVTMRTDGECGAIISGADLRIIRQMAGPSVSESELEEQTCHTVRYALSRFADGHIQEVRDILSFSPDRSSVRGTVSARNHKIKSLMTIWLGIVMVAALSMRSVSLMLVIYIVGLVAALIALAITLYINKRQMSSVER